MERALQGAPHPCEGTTREVKSFLAGMFPEKRGIMGLQCSPGFSQAWCLDLCLFHKQLTVRTDLAVSAADVSENKQ